MGGLQFREQRFLRDKGHRLEDAAVSHVVCQDLHWFAVAWRAKLVGGRRGLAGPHGIHRGNGAAVRDSRDEGALGTVALRVDAVGSGGQGGGTRHILGGHSRATIADAGNLIALDGAATIRRGRLPGDDGATARGHGGGP